MAKGRLIYEGFVSSGKVNALSWRDQRLYLGLMIAVADDYGIFEWDPEVILAAVFPKSLGKVSVRDVEDGLKAMSSEQVGLVKQYTINGGKRYGALWNFRQKVRYPKRLHPKPPPDVLSWQQSADSAWEDSTAAPREPESKPSQPQGEGEADTKARVHGVAPAALCAYALEHCDMRISIPDAVRAIRSVGEQHDWTLAKALESIAARDQRTRWGSAINRVGIWVSIAQEIRDGIHAFADGDYEPFLAWCARQGINPKGGPAEGPAIGNRQSAIGGAP